MLASTQSRRSSVAVRNIERKSVPSRRPVRSDFLEPELGAVEIESGVEIADAQHGVKISHGGLFEPVGVLRPSGGHLPDGSIYACVPTVETARQPACANLIDVVTCGGAVHRGGHLDRVRHPRLPLARRVCGPRTSPGLVRRLPVESARCGTRHGVAASPWRSEFSRQPVRVADTWRSPASIALGKVPAVITQNIDNLHQASGVAAEDVVELHGNTTYALCLTCGCRYELAWVKQRFAASGHAPDCPDCGGHVKTATVSFGQAMPEAAMRRAETLTRSCDLFLAIGSSLVVWPAAGFPLLAKRSGAKLVILNREPTEFDDAADLVVHADIGSVLAPFVTH